MRSLPAILCLVGGALLLLPSGRIIPTPVDPVDPAPIAEDGLHVLVVYESAEMTEYSLGHVTVLSSIMGAGELRKWLDDNAEWRCLDQDADMTHAPDVWIEAMERGRDSLPWIVVSNGTTGTEQELPDSVDATLALIKGLDK